MFRRIFITSVTTVALIASGLGLSAPAMAADKPADAVASQRSAPVFELGVTQKEQLVTGGVIKLFGAKAQIVNEALVVVGKFGQTLETLPDQVSDATGKPIGLLYDVSNPESITFEFVKIGKNRFDWRCPLAIGASASVGGAAGSIAGGALGTGIGFGFLGGPSGALVGFIGGGMIGGGLGTVAGAAYGAKNFC